MAVGRLVAACRKGEFETVARIKDGSIIIRYIYDPKAAKLVKVKDSSSA